MAAPVKATAVAESATAAYRKAQKERRRIRSLRISAVYGPPLVAICGGYVTSGWLGLTGGPAATFTAGAFAGHPMSNDADWTVDWRSLGDGDAMTAPMLDASFRAARVIGSEESLRVVRMPMLDERGDWSAVLDLPPGIPAKNAFNTRSERARRPGPAQAPQPQRARPLQFHPVRPARRTAAPERPGRGRAGR
nr:hypothetical protein OG781_09915 [Streptomyces sp. NBC_00830]